MLSDVYGNIDDGRGLLRNRTFAFENIFGGLPQTGKVVPTMHFCDRLFEDLNLVQF